MTYTTETNYTQSVTGNRDFNVGFPFLDTADIKVQQNGTTKTLSNDYTIVQSGANTTVNFNTAPADNDTIRLFRDTAIDAIEATYTAGSSIRASDLNTNNKQLLFAAQEFGTLKSDNSVSFTLGDKGDLSVNSSSSWSLNNNSIELANMADNSVGTNELVNDSVTDDKMANDAIGTAMIKDNAITIAKMADNSVSTAEVVNSSVTLAKLAANTLTSIQTTYSNPVGTVIWYAGTSAPTGYLKANGDAIANGSGTTQSITADFSALYAIVGANLPDLRGEFIRGFDDGKGTDSGRSIRSTQDDGFKEHTHTASVTDPGHNHNLTAAYSIGGHTDDGGAPDERSTTQSLTTQSQTTGISVSNANTGGTETRPRNIALLACIKY